MRNKKTTDVRSSMLAGVLVVAAFTFFAPAAVGATLQNLETTQIQATTCTPPPPATSFSTTGSSIWAYFSISGLKTGDKVILTWNRPTSGSYQVGPWQGYSGTQCYAVSLTAAQFAPYPGSWFLAVAIDGVYQSLRPSFTVNNTAPPHLTQSPSQLNLSTGDTSTVITTSLTPASSYKPGFVTTAVSNPNSSCAAALTFSAGTGVGSVNSSVTAGPAGCSGVFNVVATANTGSSSVSGSNSTQVVVPPQIMIKTLVGEAGSQRSAGDDTMPALLLVAKNRFGDSSFRDLSAGASCGGGHVGTGLLPTNWQTTLVPCQFYGATNSTATGVAPELTYASSVFSNTSTVNIPTSCKGYWSPTNAQFQVLQTWSNTPANKISDSTWPNSVGAPTLWNGKPKQAVIKNSIANNVLFGSTAAPAIVLFCLAPSATAPAVVRIP